MKLHINTLTIYEAFPNFNDNKVKELERAILIAVSSDFQRRWIGLVNKGLHSTRAQYLQNINFFLSDNQAGFVLTGQLPNMLETGASAWDMKKNFLNSPKAKIGKNGAKYISIPFRHATPSAIGENSAFSNVMTEAVYNEAKALKPFTSDYRTGMIQRGESLKANQLNGKDAEKRTRPLIIERAENLGANKSAAYTHKNSISDGMIRNEKTYEKGVQSSYMTFRRVSENSEINSWIHKGFEARNFITQAANELPIELVVSNAVTSFLSK